MFALIVMECHNKGAIFWGNVNMRMEVEEIKVEVRYNMVSQV